MTEAKLNVADRINLLNILPEQGGFETAKLVRQLRERLSMDEAEVEMYTYENEEGGRLFRNVDKAPETAYSFSAFEVVMIVAALKKLDKEEKVSPVHVPLWEKFIERVEEKER